MTEEMRCTCLDRARIALEQTGQIHCAGVMRELQERFDVLAREFNELGIPGSRVLDPNKPCEILDELM